jgi:hypothetical protein
MYPDPSWYRTAHIEYQSADEIAVDILPSPYHALHDMASASGKYSQVGCCASKGSMAFHFTSGFEGRCNTGLTILEMDWWARWLDHDVSVH